MYVYHLALLTQVTEVLISGIYSGATQVKVLVGLSELICFILKSCLFVFSHHEINNYITKTNKFTVIFFSLAFSLFFSLALYLSFRVSLKYWIIRNINLISIQSLIIYMLVDKILLH